ncbi:MAG: HAMP domain-containing histidine kinase [Cytophagaceae bacterium]|jgi:hypothetical protein|nr:HAMP domain-containing histidine kinase [Cytophagaceae bacterium]
MQLYSKKRRWKFFLILGAVGISIFSMIYTSRLSSELKEEEQKRMKIWSAAYNALINDSDGESNLYISLILEIIESNSTIPSILVDDKDSILWHRNIQLPAKNQEIFLQKELGDMKDDSEPIVVYLGDGITQYFYYHDSVLISQLQWFPVIQLLIVFVFILVAYAAFSTARRWEQDNVWVGMARETAHQLGTPTSSLLGWMDILDMKEIEPDLVKEMRFDVRRLQTITARFSKIGSKPELLYENITETVEQMIYYLQNRSSKLVKFSLQSNVGDTIVRMSRPLFEWVIENICKNAIDAMEGEGSIDIYIYQQKNIVGIDISDTGKGMTRNMQKSVFKPGYSTKPKGWGLGLTLTKRIVEQYHGGKIHIASSTPGKGTTFRILIPE